MCAYVYNYSSCDVQNIVVQEKWGADGQAHIRDPTGKYL